MTAGTDSTTHDTDVVACEKCGHQTPSEELVEHHIVPLAAGGSDEPDNIATLCRHCARYAPDDFLDREEYEPVFADYVDTDTRPEVDFAYFGVIATEKLATAYRGAAGGITGELDADELVESIDPIVNTVQSLSETEDYPQSGLLLDSLCTVCGVRLSHRGRLAHREVYRRRSDNLIYVSN